MEKREAIVPRDRVCYRSNVRTAIVSPLSLSLFLFSIFIFIFIYFLLFCVQLSLPLLASFDSLSRLRPHANPLLFHPRGSLFSPQVFFIFLPLHFATTGFHGQLISSHSFVSYSLFNSHCIFDLASSPRFSKQTGLQTARAMARGKLRGIFACLVSIEYFIYIYRDNEGLEEPVRQSSRFLHLFRPLFTLDNAHAHRSENSDPIRKTVRFGMKAKQLRLYTMTFESYELYSKNSFLFLTDCYSLYS